MFKQIVVGVDGSQNAEDAARTAASLARATGAELHVVSAYHAGDQVRRPDGRTVPADEDATRICEQNAVAIRHLHPVLSVATDAVEGRPAEALVQVAERVDADLIVIGNKRVQGLARVLGSVATDVARKAPCDVYVARTHAR